MREPLGIQVLDLKVGQVRAQSFPRPSTSVSVNNVTNRGCMMVLLQSSRSRRGGQPDAGGAVRRDHAAAGKDLAHVVEHDHSVAQQAPSLLRVEGDGAGGIAVPVVGLGAWGLMGTHGSPPFWGYRCSGALPWRCGSSIT
jgi:hypothetical protein